MDSTQGNNGKKIISENTRASSVESSKAKAVAALATLATVIVIVKY